MSEEKMNLVKKMAKVMKEVQYIEKRGWNNFSKYKYATEADVSEKVREVLADQNVIMLPNVIEHKTREHTNRKGNTEYIATVTVEFTFHDGDTGDRLTIHSVGEGQDAGDKAVYKAITGAQKYALMKAFMIPTGDDPENDEGVDERNGIEETKASDKQLNLVNMLISDVAKQYQRESAVIYQKVKEHLKTDNEIENFTKSEASKAIEYLNEAKNKTA